MSFRDLWKRVIVAWRWDRAVEKTTKGHYQDAMQEIVKAEEAIGARLPPQFLLLKGVLLRWLGESQAALGCVIKAREEFATYRGYPKADQEYLIYFASDLESKIAREKNPESTIHSNGVVDFSKVRATTRKIFPLRHHPQWRA
jgi:hypothetical protein